MTYFFDHESFLSSVKAAEFDHISTPHLVTKKHHRHHSVDVIIFGHISHEILFSGFYCTNFFENHSCWATSLNCILEISCRGACVVGVNWQQRFPSGLWLMEMRMMIDLGWFSGWSSSSLIISTQLEPIIPSVKFYHCVIQTE